MSVSLSNQCDNSAAVRCPGGGAVCTLEVLDTGESPLGGVERDIWRAHEYATQNGTGSNFLFISGIFRVLIWLTQN